MAAQQRLVAETAGHRGDHFASNYIHYEVDTNVEVPVAEPAADEEEPEVDIVINNVVSSFNTRCHLNLKRVATEGMNVIYKRDQGVSILSLCM